MALNIEFEGFVNEVKTFDWGTVAVIAHSQRAKNDATGQWETVGKDYLDVTLPQGHVGIAENDRVAVSGSLKVSTYPKKDGTSGVALKVRATSIEHVERTGAPALSVVPSDDLPF